MLAFPGIAAIASAIYFRHEFSVHEVAPDQRLVVECVPLVVKYL